MNYANVNPEFLWALDIETAASDKADEFVNRYEDIKAPSTWKDEEKIKANIEEKKQAHMDKAALRWLTGKVISYAMINVADVLFERPKKRAVSACGFDEQALLKGMMVAIESNNIVMIGTKSGDAFDIPFIKGRCIATNTPMHELFASTYSFLDVDKMICPSSQGNQRATLEQYAFACGLAGKSGSGAMVPKQYLEAIGHRMNGDNAKVKEIMLGIKAYNEQDTLITAQLLARFVARGDFSGTK